jgi:hypothetical protein
VQAPRGRRTIAGYRIRLSVAVATEIVSGQTDREV